MTLQEIERDTVQNLRHKVVYNPVTTDDGTARGDNHTYKDPHSTTAIIPRYETYAGMSKRLTITAFYNITKTKLIGYDSLCRIGRQNLPMCMATRR